MKQLEKATLRAQGMWRMRYCNPQFRWAKQVAGVLLYAHAMRKYSPKGPEKGLDGRFGSDQARGSQPTPRSDSPPSLWTLGGLLRDGKSTPQAPKTAGVC